MVAGSTFYVMNKTIERRCSPKCDICGELIQVGEETVSKVSRYNHSRTWYHGRCHEKLYYPYRRKRSI